MGMDDKLPNQVVHGGRRGETDDDDEEKKDVEVSAQAKPSSATRLE